MDNEILARCPMCGSTQIEVVKLHSSLYPYSVECARCGVKTVYYTTREEAVAAWSHRPIETMLRGELEDARKEAEEAKKRHTHIYAMPDIDISELMRLAKSKDMQNDNHS